MLTNVYSASKIQCDATTNASAMSSNTDIEETALKCLKDCQNVQLMIDLNCEHLHRLRTPMPSRSVTPGGNNITPTSGIYIA